MTRPVDSRRVGALAVALMLPWLAWTTAAPAAAQAQTKPHQHVSEPGDPALDPTLCLGCPAGREASGTSWQPDVTPIHGQAITLGTWILKAHGSAAFAYTRERGPRGDAGGFGLSHLRVDAQRRVGSGGVIGVRSMWTLEPLMGPRGYPLLLQTGETADGVNPLIDRQHPHDLAMELAFTYARRLGDDRGCYVYVAAVGAPALGPPPFMHRRSAAGLPLAPIGHHWFDATHTTYGVVTAGFISSPRVVFEGSAFRGREPDEHRWGLEAPALDSFSGRLSVNPTPALALQVSAGFLAEPEQLHPGADVTRITGSAMYSARWRSASLDTMLGWSRNRRTLSIVSTADGPHVRPGAVSHAAIGEAALRFGLVHTLSLRVERAQKDELFPVDDLRHDLRYPVTRATGGYRIDLARGGPLALGLGAALSWTRVSEELRGEYGGPPASVLAFVDVRLH